MRRLKNEEDISEDIGRSNAFYKAKQTMSTCTPSARLSPKTTV